MDQIILACDDSGKFIEYIPKDKGHKGEGRRHLAVTVLLYNSKGQVLLQRRKHKVFDKTWDFTASTHPLYKEDGTDESLEEAARRCLEAEWGIKEVGDIRVIGEFNYFAKIGQLCENEHDNLLVGEYDGEVSLNPEVGYEYKWMDKKELIEDIEKNPGNYSPWATAALTLLNNL